MESGRDRSVPTVHRIFRSVRLGTRYYRLVACASRRSNRMNPLLLPLNKQAKRSLRKAKLSMSRSCHHSCRRVGLYVSVAKNLRTRRREVDLLFGRSWLDIDLSLIVGPVRASESPMHGHTIQEDRRIMVVPGTCRHLIDRCHTARDP